MKTSELTGAALDWAVAKCEGVQVEKIMGLSLWSSANWHMYSTDWSQGGPIIEREGVNLSAHYKIHTGEWQAWCEHGPSAYGPTSLIAAMRCFCASRLGDEVDVPEELI